MFGDYEAQRHWMEVTLNLKVKDWYQNTTDNDLGYWGIDYPPLSAYQSWISGKFLSLFDADAVELHSSRGYENELSKLGMRLSVLASDLLIYIPACVAWTSTIPKISSRVLVLAWMICNPALLIIDHGHFQYNSISLGLAVAAIYNIAIDRHVLGSFFFCGALNHKQMTLYFAPAFFFHLFGVCMQQEGIGRKIRMLTKLGITVLVAFFLFWLPFLKPYSVFIQVLRRIFPLQRGLYEDYVANFWCVSSLVFKWRRYFSGSMLAKFCACATMLFSLPSLLMQFTKPKGSTFILCLANTSLAFFLFSFQVHEKSILIPLVPLSMLLSREGKVVSINMISISLMTMYPLLKKDGLVIVYFSMHLLTLAIQCALDGEMLSRNLISRNVFLSIKEAAFSPVLVPVGVSIVHAVCYLIQPWSTKEYISDAVIMATGFVFLIIQTMVTNVHQFVLWRDGDNHAGYKNGRK